MTAAGPWSVKGIDPKAREIAKDLARRSGMTLGEWLNQMIIDGGESEPPPFEAPPQPAPYSDTRRRVLDELYREARTARTNPPPLRQPEPRFYDQRPSDAPEVTRVARALSDLSLRMEAAEQRSTLAISGVDQSVMGVLSRLDDLEREQGAGGMRLEGSVIEVRAAQAQVADRLRRLEHEDSARVEALKALESALGRIAGHMQQTDATTGAAREALDALSKRVQQVETATADAPSAYADAEKVDTVLSRLAERLDQAEVRTSAAVQSLQTSFAGLDARLRHGESRNVGPSSAELERRFQTLVEDLSQRVEASRAELAQRLQAVAGDRIDGMEAALRDLKGQVDQAEQRSAQAIERISREVMRVAQGLGERVAASEHQIKARTVQADERIAAVEARSAAAVESLGGEVARIADVMETRMRQTDGAQAEALEKLGGEIARIAERLAERISSSDRRSAEAIDEVSDKVVRISEQMDERQTRGVSELADRIRQSEERTAKLLEDAQARLDQRLNARPAAVETPPPPHTAPAPPNDMAAFAARPTATAGLSNSDPFGGVPPLEDPLFAPAPQPPAAPAPQAHSPQAAPPFAPMPAPAPAPVNFDADDFVLDNDPFAHRSAFAGELSPFDPQDDFEPAPRAATASLAPGLSGGMAPPFPQPSALEPPMPLSMGPPAAFSEPSATPAFAAPDPAASSFMGFSVSDFAPAAAEAAPSTAQMSTREMLEEARQAAKRAAGGRAEPPPGSVPAPAQDAAARAPRPFGLSLPKRKKETAPTLRTVALASLTAVAATTAVLGAYKLSRGAHNGPDAGDHHATSPSDLTAAAAPSAAPPLGASSATPGLAAALTPLSIAPGASAKPATATPAKSKAPAVPPAQTIEATAKTAPAKPAHAIYTDAVSRIETGDLTALTDLKKAAAMGDGSAQFYLARLYEAGGAGLSKDISEARRWTQKAAEGGDPLAMYNYASYAYAGDGGAKDIGTAVTWFRRAADRGVVNSQYNLAQLYEKGYGVPQDNAEAYKWYLAASSAGDAGAKAAATALKAKLAPDAQAKAEKAATTLHAQTAVETSKTAQATPRP